MQIKKRKVYPFLFHIHFMFDEIIIPILISYLRKKLVSSIFAFYKNFTVVEVADNNLAVINLKFLI